MTRERGSLLVTLGLAVGALILVAAIGLWVDRHWETTAGVRKGEAKVRADWDRKNLEAQAAEDLAAAERLKLAREHAKRLLKADEAATAANNSWKEAVNDLKRSKRALAVCAEPKGSEDGGSPGVLLTGDFVRLFDAAWTGSQGEPLFGVLGGGAAPGGPPDPAEAVGPDEVLDAHGANARTCSDNLRRLDALTVKIRALRDGWKPPEASREGG